VPPYVRIKARRIRERRFASAVSAIWTPGA
jgi:hypothetical protein